jgi:hypothetical protein
MAGEKLGPAQKLEPGDQVLQWSSDDKSIFINQADGHKARIFRFDLSTGRRTLFREIVPSDAAGYTGPLVPVITPDGSAYAYGGYRILSDLYLVEGLK